VRNVLFYLLINKDIFIILSAIFCKKSERSLIEKKMTST